MLGARTAIRSIAGGVGIAKWIALGVLSFWAAPAQAADMPPPLTCTGGKIPKGVVSATGGFFDPTRPLCSVGDAITSVAGAVTQCAVPGQPATVYPNVIWDLPSAVDCYYRGESQSYPPGRHVHQYQCTQKSHNKNSPTGPAGFPYMGWDLLLECVTCTGDADCNDGKACNGGERCVSGVCKSASVPPPATCGNCPAGELWNGSACIPAASCTGQAQFGQCLGGSLANKCEDCDPAKGALWIGDPIHPGAGVSRQAEPIFSSSTLELTLVYNSLPTGAYLPPRSYPFGTLWSHRYGAQLLTALDPFTVAAVRPSGQIYSFSAPSSGTRYGADRDVSETLDKIVDAGNVITGYRITIPAEQVVELYDAAGTLLSVTDRTGRVTTLTYSTAATPVAVAPKAGLLLQVTDDFGRSMGFVYDASSRVSTVTDPAGANYTFKYDEASSTGAANNLTSVTFPGGAKRTYFYNEAAHVASAQSNALTGIKDENGTRFVTWKFDAQGRATGSLVGGPTGLENTTAVFGANAVTVTDPAGAVRTYATTLVNGVGKVVSISGPPCPSCGPAAQNFDVNGYLTSVADWNGNVTTFERTDARKNLETSRTEAFGTPLARTITTTWHPTRDVPTLVSEPGRTTTFTYDASGNMLTLSLKDTASNNARTWSFSYDAHGRVVTLDGPRTDVTDTVAYAYYADGATCAGASSLGCRGQLAAQSDALGHLTQYLEYDAYGNPLKLVDPNGTTMTLAYDARQRLTSRSVGGLVTSYTYDAAGLVTRITMPDASFVDLAYDAAHRLTDLADNLGNRVKYTLDGLGNRTAETIRDPSNNVTQSRTWVFSNLGRLTKSLGALGQTTTYAYDTQGNLTSVTDPLSRTTTRAYDALNRLIKATDAAGGVTDFGYDARDRLVSVTDPRSLVTQYAVDALGDVLKVTSPDTGVANATFDAAGNVVSRTDAKGQATTYEYDALNRVVAVHYADGTQASYDYDSGANGIGRLTAVTDASGARAYLYDALGRLVQESQAITAGGNNVSLTLGYQYDAVGHLTKMTYPNGQAVKYAYDALGRVGKVSLDAAGPNPTTTTLMDLIAYKPFGPVTSYKTQGGAVIARAVDLDGRIASYTAAGKTWTVAYDAASRITSIADAANATDARTYAYDALDRLVAAVTPAGAESYEYDAVGNRTKRGAQTLSYGAGNQRLLATSAPDARSYAYDENGSPTTDGIRSFAYDARGRLTKMTSGSVVANYLVGSNGLRVAKTVTR